MAEDTILKNLDAIEIQKYQQNRCPCFFVDRIEEAVPGKYAKGYKNFTYNEWFFPAHFEDEPNVPGFVQVETLTQVFLMTFLTMPENKGKKRALFPSITQSLRKKLSPVTNWRWLQSLNPIAEGSQKAKSKAMLTENRQTKWNLLFRFLKSC